MHHHPLAPVRRRRALVGATALGLLAGTLSTLGGPLPSASAAAAGDLSTGTLVRAYVDPQLGRDTSPHVTAPAGDQLTWLDLGHGHRVRVPSDQVRNLPSGARVRLRLGADRRLPQDRPEAGRPVLAATVLEAPATAAGTVSGSTTTATTTAAATTATTTTTTTTPTTTETPWSTTDWHDVYLVQVRPPGTDPAAATTPLATATGMVNGAVSTYWSGQTDGRVRFRVVKALAWTSIAVGCSDPDRLANAAAALVGLGTSAPLSGKHLLIQLPTQMPGCAAGLGVVGTLAGHGGWAYFSYPQWNVVAHEFGHNLGLGHASSLDCGAVADRTSGCVAVPYSDRYDPMGVSWWHTGNLNTAHLQQLGVLGPQRQDVTASTTVWLQPLSGRGGVRAVRVQDGTRTYSLEYRNGTGDDAWSGSAGTYDNAGYTSGVTVRRDGTEQDSSGASYDADTWLLHPTGNSTGSGPWTLPLGSPMTTAAGGATFTVLQQSAAGALVRVTVGGVAPPQVTPRFTALATRLATTGTVSGTTAWTRTGAGTLSWTSPATGGPDGGYQVIVDGSIVADLPAGATSYALATQPGTHQVVVRAVDQGLVVAAPAWTVVDDRTAPAFTRWPWLYLRGGTVSTGAVPVSLAFAATDGVRLASLRATSPRPTSFATTATSWATTQVPGTSTTYGVVAADAAGNTVGASSARTLRLGSEWWGAWYAGRWSTTTATYLLNGAARTSTTRGAAVSFTATARGFGLVAMKGPNRGRAWVYVDGGYVGTLDLYSPTYAARQLVWSRHFAASGRHTVRLVVQGTYGRPTVMVDGWATLS